MRTPQMPAGRLRAFGRTRSKALTLPRRLLDHQVGVNRNKQRQAFLLDATKAARRCGVELMAASLPEHYRAEYRERRMGEEAPLDDLLPKADKAKAKDGKAEDGKAEDGKVEMASSATPPQQMVSLRT